MDRYEYDFKRLESGIFFDENLKPYSKKRLSDMLDYYKDLELYNNCSLIRDIIKLRFK
jgi:hypothetical protein